MPKVIEFPKTEPQWIASRASVLFFALVDRNVVRCLLSIEALWEHFGVRSQSAEETLPAFRAYRSVIEQVARVKLEGGDGLRSEIVLRPDDFPRQTTTTASPQLKHLVTKEPPAIRNDPELSQKVKVANSILEDYVQTRLHVTAEWNSIPDSTEPLYQLTLKDDETQASVNTLFTRAALNDLPSAWYPLYRIWDNLLSERSNLLSEQYTRLSQVVGAGADIGE